MCSTLLEGKGGRESKSRDRRFSLTSKEIAYAKRAS